MTGGRARLVTPSEMSHRTLLPVADLPDLARRLGQGSFPEEPAVANGNPIRSAMLLEDPRQDGANLSVLGHLVGRVRPRPPAVQVLWRGEDLRDIVGPVAVERETASRQPLANPVPRPERVVRARPPKRRGQPGAPGRRR